MGTQRRPNDDEMSTGSSSSNDSSSDGSESTSSSSTSENSASKKKHEKNEDEYDSSESDGCDEQMLDKQSDEPMNDVDGGSSSGGSNSDDGNDTDDNDDDVENIPKSADAPTISKSWATLTTHSPCYTGGSVSFSHAPSTIAMAASTNTITSSNEDQHSSQHFILAQRGGDVAIIEAATGLLLRTVHKGKMFQGGGDLSSEYNEDDDDAEDDDEEMMDAEAITAFALAPNNTDIIAVTRSHLVRKYNLAGVRDKGGDVKKKEDNRKQQSKGDREDEKNDKPIVQSVTSISEPAQVSFSFGKSGHKLPVTKVAFHPSGIFFATGSVDGLVKIWDVRNGYATHALHATSSSNGGGTRGRYGVTCIEWRQSKTALILAIGREDGSISIHDLLLNVHDTKQASLPVAVLRDHLSDVTCVAWASEVVGGGSSTTTSTSGTRKHGGGIFFSSGRDSVINTWFISEEEVKETDVPKRKKKKANRDDIGQRTPQVSVKVSYRRIRTLPVYEQVEGMILLPRKFRPALETRDQQELLEKKDVVLATCGTKGIVRLWKATPGDREGGIQNVLSDLSPLGAQSDNEAFGEDHGGYTSIHLTNLSTTHISPMLVAVDAEHNMSFLRMQWTTDEAPKLGFVTDRAIVGHNGEILDLSVIPQPRGSDNTGGGRHMVAIATNSSQVRTFCLGESNEDEMGEDTQKHSALSPLGLLDGHDAIVISIDASPCGRYLATASKDKTMRLWHIPSQKCIAIATGHTEAIGAVALSNKIGCYDVGGSAAENGAGSFAVTASKDRTLKVWPLPGSAVLNRWAEVEGEKNPLNARLSARAHEKDINIVSVAPNDALIATGSQDKQVKLWRSTDLALHGTLKGHKRGVWDVQFSPQDRVVATASGDRTIKLWSMTDCRCIRTFQGHMAGVLRVRFLSGLQLISSGSDGLIKLWTIKTNECESTMDGHDDKIWALDLSPCGTALFSGGADSKLAVWRDTTKERDDAVREAEEQNVMMEQKLSNHLRHKQYEKALEIALELDKPNQVLRVLTEIVEKDTKNNKQGIQTLQKHVVKWSPDRLKQMLKYVREWNTRARNSHIAMLVVKAVVTTIPAYKLATEYDGVPEIMAQIAPYAERHFDRLDRMVGDSYLLDYTLFSQGSLHGASSESYNEWVERSKPVLPPVEAEGKIQVGGSLIVGGKKNKGGDESDSDDSEVLTIGDSDTEDES